MLKLEDTIGLMCSDNYKDRLKAEYLQLIIRLRKAENKWRSMDSRMGAEGQHLLSQITAMKSYRYALRNRMEDEGVFAETLDAITGEE